jgi:hypothetical protein
MLLYNITVCVWDPGHSSTPVLTLCMPTSIAQIAWGVNETGLTLALADASGEIRCVPF